MKYTEEIIYCHEHTTIDLSKGKNTLDCILNNEKDTIEEFKELKIKNVSTIIDMTNIGMGRNVEYINKASEKSGLNILVSTGYYKEPFLPPEVYKINEKRISEVFIDEIINGIDETDVKARVIGEIGTSLNKICKIEEKILRAACRAHIETGVPIVTHTALGNLGNEQIKIFQKYNVNLNNVILSHIDLSGDIEYMKNLLAKGVNIAFDTIGKNNYQLDENRAKWLKILCDLGYSNQIVLSMDITRKSHLKINNGLGYGYLIDKFIPMLYKIEINDKHMKNMLVNNIKRIYKMT